jgi:hypothetical protein
MNIQIAIQKMKISSTSKTFDTSDRYELGFDCTFAVSVEFKGRIGIQYHTPKIELSGDILIRLTIQQNQV